MSQDKDLKLDIGCGRNKREGFVGIDIDPESKADIIASALDLPFKDESAKEVFSSHLVEHFSPGEAKKFFSEVYRVLIKGGKAFVKVDTDWTKKRLLKKDPTHKYRFSVREIKKILQSFGFSKIKVEKKIYKIKYSIRNKIFVELVK